MFCPGRSARNIELSMSLHVEGSQGLQVGDLAALQNQVRLRGGLLIVYAEVVSALMFSVRSYKVKWVAAASERVAAGLPSTLITSLLGWWAIFGPYRSITALIWNKRGGFDVTDALLRAYPGNFSLLSYSAATAIAEFEESASRISRRVCLTLFGLLAIGLVCMIWWASRK